MSFKQLYSSSDLKPIEKTAFGNNGSFSSSGLSAVKGNSDQSGENHLMFQLQKMEQLNAHLENLVDQRTKELAEVVATNAKFISIIAHDLRSPFSSILGVLEILKESLNDYNINEIEKYIDIVSDSANRTLTLLDNLLVWTISQNKEKNFNPVKINQYELLSDEVESNTTLARQKQISLNYSVTPNLHVSADIQMVKTILRNLIGNAIKYTGAGGEITISASEIKQYVEIVIKDNGIGISNDAQRELFKTNSFHSTTGTNNEQGTGLGLLLCKEFVEMHGGYIRIDSKPGKGSKFKFTLPHYI